MDKVQEAKKLREAGNSFREIAKQLKVSKTTAVNYCNKQNPQTPVEKSWLNPRWTSIDDDRQPVDLYGAIEAPNAAKLISCCEDTVYDCQTWIANSVAQTFMKILVKTHPGQQQPKAPTAPVRNLRSKSLQLLAKSNGIREVIDHMTVDLLNHPNPEMSRYDYLYFVDSMLSLCGESFVLKEREEFKRLDDTRYINKGYPVRLWPLMNAYVVPQTEKGKVVGYMYNLENPPQFWKKEDIIHFKLTNPANPYTAGYGPVRAIYERFLLQKNEIAYLLSLFRNQARPDSMILLKGGATPDQCERLQKEMTMRYRQGGIGGTWVVDGESFDIKQLQWSPKDMLGDELYKWTKTQIINAFSLNDALFSTENSNRAVATQAERSAQKRAILPRLKAIEEKYNHDLLPEFDDRLVAEFDNPVEQDEDFDLQRNTQNADRILQLQTGVYGGTLPRDAGIATAATLLGVSDEEASRYFPIKQDGEQ